MLQSTIKYDDGRTVLIWADTWIRNVTAVFAKSKGGLLSFELLGINMRVDDQTNLPKLLRDFNVQLQLRNEKSP